MERYYEIAGIPICVTGADEWMYRDDGVLAPFRTQTKACACSLEVQVVDTLCQPEGELVFSDPTMRVFRSGETQLRYKGPVSENLSGAYLCIQRRDNHAVAQVLKRVIPGMVSPKLTLDAMEAEHLIVAHHGFLLHASYICHQGKGILFTAPSGTGKSTQAELWLRLRGAELINGDRAAVMTDSAGITVRGIPYSGSSGIYKNRTLPLAAIVYLSQAPQTQIRKLKGLQAFRRVWEGCSVNVWNREDMSRCSQTVMDTVERIPVFHLACTPDESAVKALEEVLKEGR